MKELFKALAKFNQEVPVIHEGTKGFNYTYSDLNTIFKVIKPLLSKNGLSFTQVFNGDSLKTILFEVKSGESIESTLNIPQNVSLKGQNDFQTLGSGITYLRRYSLACILGLITDKDADAHGEQKKVLDAKGFDYLVGDKSTLEQVNTALNERSMDENQRNTLLLKKKDLETLNNK